MFCTDSTDRRIIKSVADLGFLLKDHRFRLLVRKQAPFERSDVMPEDLLDLLIDKVSILCIKVNTYKPFYWRSKAYARFMKKNPNQIELSSRRLHRYNDPKENNASLVGSEVHELTHLVDNKFPLLSFGHGGNKNQHLKKNCAPNKMGALAKQFVLEHYS